MSINKSYESATESRTPSSSASEAVTDGWDTVRRTYINQGIDTGTIDIIMHSWRKGTKSSYSKYLKLWKKYSSQVNIDLTNPPVHTALKFLTNLHEKGESYGQLNTACSALPAVILPKNNISLREITYSKKVYERHFPKNLFFKIHSNLHF